MPTISQIISTLIQCLIGWILIVKVPSWLKLRGIFATIIRVIGVIVIIYALLAYV